MRHYELIILIHPDQSEQVPSMLDRYKTLITETHQGTVHRVEDWGRRQTAYPVKELHKAHYVLMNFSAHQAVLEDFENLFKYNDAILRHLIIKCKGPVTEASPLARSKEHEHRQEDSGKKPNRHPAHSEEATASEDESAE